MQSFLNNVYVVGSSISLLRIGRWMCGFQIRCPCLVAPRGLPIRGPPLAPEIPQEELLRGKNRTRRIASWGQIFKKSPETQFSLVNDNPVPVGSPGCSGCSGPSTRRIASRKKLHKKNCFVGANFEKVSRNPIFPSQR